MSEPTELQKLHHEMVRIAATSLSEDSRFVAVLGGGTGERSIICGLVDGKLQTLVEIRTGKEITVQL